MFSLHSTLRSPGKDGAPHPQIRIQRATASAASRLAAEELAPPVIDAERNRSKQSDWSRVRAVQEGEIVLTLYGAPPARRYVVRGTASEAGLTVLDVTDPNIPREVRNAMLRLASQPDNHLRLARPGRTVDLNKRVRLAGGAVLLDGRKVIELEQVVQDVPRSRVAEIARMHSGTGQGMGWGTLAGTTIGLALVLSSCGTNWNKETHSCGNLDGALPVVGAVWGFAIGGVAGAATRVSSVVYRGPDTESMPLSQAPTAAGAAGSLLLRCGGALAVPVEELEQAGEVRGDHTAVCTSGDFDVDRLHAEFPRFCHHGP